MLQASSSGFHVDVQNIMLEGYLGSVIDVISPTRNLIMIKKISLAAILALGSLSVAAPRASAFDVDCLPIPEIGQYCEPPTEIPTPPAVLAAIGMGFAGLRKKQQNEQSEE